MSGLPHPSTIEDSIRERLADVEDRIETACARVNRDPASVRLIAVTKTFPIEIVAAAMAAGLTDFGENRVQELDEKASAMPGRVQGGEIRWHLVGSLQRNKSRRAIETADEFHALDSERLARELDRRAAAAERILPCYVQVNVSGEDSKSGLHPRDTHAFLDSVKMHENLDVIGLMTLAAPAETEAEFEHVVRPQLRMLAEVARTYTAGSDRRGGLRLSMGMSGDYEIAIEEGATDIRLGTALFGAR